MITTGRLGKEFKEAVTKIYKEDELSIDYYETIDQDLINKFNALASFAPSQDLDLSHIKWIHSFGAGVNGFLKQFNLNSDVKISRTTGLLGEKMAEYCLCYILIHNQNSFKNKVNQDRKNWSQPEITNLNSNSIAILGTGEMGRAIAAKLTQFNCDVYGINRNGNPHPEFKKCYKFEDFKQSPPSIDILISILPSTKETVNILDHSFFRKLSDIHFINVGRGDVIQEETLLKLLSENKIKQATLDVFPSEPLSANSKLWQHEKVIITPHQAALTDVNDILISFKKIFDNIKGNSEYSDFVDLKKGY